MADRWRTDFWGTPVPDRFIIGAEADGRQAKVDLDRLVESRMLVQANSGAGKSWALRRLLEQTHGKIQQLVIDVEDEFHTLREKYDYVLAGRHGGDCPADVRSAPLLARRLLELGASTIMGIYELQARDRVRFVRLFLESLVNAPRDLWHPVLVVVDEAHIFAPQVGEAESAAAVIDLMTRGRKRGFCGILATQRISKLHKDAAAEANNKLIGRSALDVDMKRAADELGFSTREQQNSLRTMKPGEFFAFGPAVSDVVTLVKVGPVETTHPKAGQRAAAPPPPREKVRAVLAQLADLPKEAEAELQTVADLRRKNAALEMELRKARVAAPVPDASAVTAARQEGRREADERLKLILSGYDHWTREVRLLADDVKRRLDDLHRPAAFQVDDMRRELSSRGPVRPQTPAIKTVDGGRVSKTPAKSSPPVGGLTGPEQRILDAIAWLESIGVEQPEQTAVAFLAGYTIGGGAFNNPRGALRTKGLVEYAGGDRIVLTDDGRASANFPDGALTTEELQRRVMERLPGPERRILEVILQAYPNPLANDECARQAGYEPGGGAYNNPRGRLRSLGLIEYPQAGYVKARGLLFLEATRA
jgi:hypothetical protein